MQISVPSAAILEGPHVNWRHVDGPLMTWAGQLHWLTWRERILIALMMTTVDRLACRRWPQIDGIRKTLRNQANIDAMLAD